MNFSIKKWFTLWEVLVLIVIVSLWLLSVFVALSNGSVYVQKIRQRIIALQLAKEWIEAVYHIRDTNWRRWAGVKDYCWLKVNPLIDEWSPRCVDDQWIMSWSYVLASKSQIWQRYWLLTWPFLAFDMNTLFSWDNMKYSVCQSWGVWFACPWIVSSSSEWMYFREIQSYGIYLKDIMVTWWTFLSCTWWFSSWCGTSRAKELRFCSVVYYVDQFVNQVKLCGVLTNFK